MKPAPFAYRRPSTLAEAIAELVAHGGDARLIAGGQSLMPMLAFRLTAPSCLIDIGRLPGLKAIDVDASGVTIGALVTWRDIEMDLRLKAAHPLLMEAISHVAHYQISNRGTVGGSLAHRPTRLTDAEASLEGRRIDVAVIRRVSGLASDGVDPPGDIHASAEYRRDLVGVLVERALARAAGITMAEAA